ncbi:phage tail protein [Pseudomonas sp. R1-18]|uniref:phage tail protein n=1 Tax=Pseudomonas sp. R1-18 TaxID=1632772 RepID=UPI003DA7F5CA
MAVETFTWCPSKGTSSTPSYRTRSSQFGDGYEQVVGDGINNKQDSWPLSFTESRDEALLIKSFLDRHGGYKAFFWTPPLGELGLYRATAPSVTPIGGGVYTLTSTFTQTFHP